MSAVKDILGLPRTGPPSSEVKEKPKEAKLERPKGMSREAYSLLYGTHPIAPTTLIKEIAKKDEERSAPASVQVTYRFMPFVNSARTDKLQLYHWVRCYKDAAGRTRPADDGDYPYAKYNKSVGVCKYDDVEYETIVRPKFPEQECGWSKAETDYLLDLCDRLDLRFVIIADRYDFPDGPKRSLEDLKERYYAIAHELACARAGGRELAANQPLVKHPYDAQKERERREFLSMVMQRTPQQAADEDAILEQAEQIMHQRKEQAAAKRTQGAPLLHPTTFSNSVSELPFFDYHVIPVAPPKPGVYLRRHMVEEAAKKQIQQQHSQRTTKTLENVMVDVANVQALPNMMTRAVSGMYLALHAEALTLVELRHWYQRSGAQMSDFGGKRAAGKMREGPLKRQRAR